MDFEGLETERAKMATEVMQELVTIVKDKKAEVSDRLKAAKQFDQMSDSIIKANLMANVVENQDGHQKKLINQLDKVINEDKDQEA